MFGQLKENIFYTLEQRKNNPDELKARFKEYFSILRGSAELRTLHSIYEMVENSKFENETIAIQFIDEALESYKPYREAKNHTSDLPKLNSLTTEVANVNIPQHIQALDQLLFNENLSIKEKYDQKTVLIKELTKTIQKKADRSDAIASLDKKVSSNLGKLTTEQKEALEVFMEQDQAKIATYYSSLIENTIDAVETKILTEDDVQLTKTLIATKKKLQEMRNEPVTIDQVDRILELRTDLNA